jgi:tRNA (uracil-5-)-methyltransferase
MTLFFEPKQYDVLLQQKVDGFVEQLKTRFKMSSNDLNSIIDVFPSDSAHYRMRAEFRIWHDGGRCYPVMFDVETRLPYEIDSFPIAGLSIDLFIQNFSTYFTSDSVLVDKLFQIECLSNQNGDCVITLIYRKKINDAWSSDAEQLQTLLSARFSKNVFVVGRSRKQKVVLDQDYVYENYLVDNKRLTFKHLEGSFTQPNGKINQSMLNWVSTCSQNLTGDALELYCGNGNFTAILAMQCNKVLANEVVKSAVQTALHNMNINNFTNATIVRMSSEELTQAMLGVREFRRLKEIDLDQFEISTVLVDPPRSGLDESTCKMINKYDNIIYISCNPTTLLNNLESLLETHSINSVACFDQFPYTPHLEAAVFLKKKNAQ